MVTDVRMVSVYPILLLFGGFRVLFLAWSVRNRVWFSLFCLLKLYMQDFYMAFVCVHIVMC